MLTASLSVAASRPMLSVSGLSRGAVEGPLRQANLGAFFLGCCTCEVAWEPLQQPMVDHTTADLISRRCVGLHVPPWGPAHDTAPWLIPRPGCLSQQFYLEPKRPNS